MKRAVLGTTATPESIERGDMLPTQPKRRARDPGALRLTRPEPSESAVLAAVLVRLSLDRRVAWAARMNSGAVTVDNRFIRFGFAGCPDILGQLRDGRLLAVEVKRPSGRTTAAQDAFLALVARHGGVAGVVRSQDDLEALLYGSGG